MANGTIVKSNGMYKLNGISGFGNNYARSTIRLSRARVLSLIALLLFSSTSGYVLATLLAPQPEQINQEPVILGDFAMTLDVNNVKDLYVWQVAITYNETELKVLEVKPGKFLGVEYPFFLNVTDIRKDVLGIGGYLCGDAPEHSGSGTLATIVFGYFDAHYQEPKIDFQSRYLSAFWMNSQLVETPFEESTLTLTVVQK